MNEEEELDPTEKELREAQEQYDAENQQVYDEVTKGNEEIRRKRTDDNDEQLELPLESRNLARVGAGLAFEVGANSLLDALTLVPGTQAVGSALINTIAQGIRGGKFSFGEVLGSAAASQIPGLAQGKAITKAGRITRAAGTGAVSGAIETTSIAAVDEGRLPTAQEFGLGVGAGGVLGAGFAKAADLADPRVTGIFRDLRARVQQGRTSSFDLAGTVAAAKPIKKINRVSRKGLINKRPTLDRTDVEYIPTKAEIIGEMRDLGLKPDEQKAAFVNAVFKKDVKDIQQTKKFLNDYFLRTEAKNLQGLAEAISAQEGVEYTVADLSNIIKNTEATTTRIVKGMPTSNKRIRNLVDLQRILKDRLRKLKQQPTFNKGHANSINNILKKFETGADRPDNIFIEEARSIYSKDATGKIKLEQIGNISKKDVGDDPLAVQRMKGFSPTVKESILKLLRKQDLEVKRVYEGLGVDTSDLDVTQNIDVSTAVRPELRDWTEETVDDLVKSGVDPEKAVDYLLDINETIGDYLVKAGIREEMELLFRKEPGLAAEFLNVLIGNKKRGSGKLANIKISEFERQLIKQVQDYFKENPLFKFKQVTKSVQKGILKPRPGEKQATRKIIKKINKDK
jgi:hypothetical protein